MVVPQENVSVPTNFALSSAELLSLQHERDAYWWLAVLFAAAAFAATDDTLREWLRSINPALQKYSIGLRDYGYENVGLLRLSNQEDFAEGLQECNVQRPHIAPLMEAFRQLMEVEVEVEQDASDSEHQGAEAPSDDDEVEEVAPPRLCSGGPLLENLPHLRALCPLNPFHAAVRPVAAPVDDNEAACPNCYCFACDAPVSACRHWRGGDPRVPAHCNAHESAEWRTQRTTAKRRRTIAQRAQASALRGNEVLTNLNLIDNSIGGEGAKALVSALRVKGVLKALKIGGNDLGDEGAKAIRDAVSGQEGFELYM
ncbi:hypothetical protein EMIHUDRAFT_220990 [Emiliania huxleyi CCMP1516]|uniref:SAM domain-containing protein n=2 Tax=Emiliania huxleyi TaxID=2903 RepID=A0A0D3HZT0_EMIH1|nr:hypothetical protein EMIHUDRAFT_220990 [Emiliania huxleyi CCMP1516]EOD04515.1 hypothetical protein EMIHUDRAFT_220990 [Emiliania huxleyi CCMP1516]|eukprot:XP_005756944.1 hypothetical protein EMIHUDRAFT_220990 [Emiliania huxleyi CCMP1516]